MTSPFLCDKRGCFELRGDAGHGDQTSGQLRIARRKLCTGTRSGGYVQAAKQGLDHVIGPR